MQWNRKPSTHSMDMRQESWHFRNHLQSLSGCGLHGLRIADGFADCALRGLWIAGFAGRLKFHIFGRPNLRSLSSGAFRGLRIADGVADCGLRRLWIADRAACGLRALLDV